ncbi:MAG: hypothetical protein QXT33_02540 [Thermofilum sp.]
MTRGRSLALLAVLLFALAAVSREAAAQPSYWLALNFRLTFYGNGTVLVEELIHPFTPEGKSLLEDREVESDLRNSIADLLRYVLLMFSDRPETILYRVGPVLDKRYGESVYCDITGTGSMSRFLGAYTLTVYVYLNRSTFVEDLGGGVYRVSIRDSFTSMDPRSWIDVIAFSFREGAALLEVEWAPEYARGPVERGEGALLWMNTNELEAPDFYIFTVKLPGFKYAGIPPEVEAFIMSARLEGSKATVVVVNRGVSSGYVIVWLKGEQVDQARRVFLNPKDRVEVTFSDVPPGNHTVVLISGTSAIDRKLLSTAADELRAEFPSPEEWWRLIVLAAALGLVAVLAVLLFRARSRASPTHTPEASLSSDYSAPSGPSVRAPQGARFSFGGGELE